MGVFLIGCDLQSPLWLFTGPAVSTLLATPAATSLPMAHAGVEHALSAPH
jgi:hypothetical protein